MRRTNPSPRTLPRESIPSPSSTAFQREKTTSYRVSPWIQLSSNLSDILKQRTTNEDLKKHAISLMEEAGSFTYTLDVLDKLMADIETRIRNLGGNKVLERKHNFSEILEG